MAKQPSRDPHPHLLLADTSTLFTQDKSVLIDPRFTELVTNYAQQFRLEVLIPAVVYGELLYQHTIHALQHLEKANDALEKVTHVTQKRYSHRVTDRRVKRETQERFDRWLRSVNGKILETPVDSIAWYEVIENALWRRGVFNSADKHEKGFRDAMILETVRDCVNNASQDLHIAFVCKDNLLREQAEDMFLADDRFSTYQRLDDFRSYLDLTKERLEEHFVRTLMRKARIRFFEPNSESCLFYRDNVRSQLRKAFSPYFEAPNTPESPLIRLGLLASGDASADDPQWEPVSPGQYVIYAPEFAARSDDKTFVWESNIKFVRHYWIPPRTLGETLFSIPRLERLLEVDFTVQWFSRVGKDGRFLETGILSMDLASNHFRPVADEDRDRFDLRSVTTD